MTLPQQRLAELLFDLGGRVEGEQLLPQASQPLGGRGLVAEGADSPAKLVDPPEVISSLASATIWRRSEPEPIITFPSRGPPVF